MFIRQFIGKMKKSYKQQKFHKTLKKIIKINDKIIKSE